MTSHSSNSNIINIDIWMEKKSQLLTFKPSTVENFKFTFLLRIFVILKKILNNKIKWWKIAEIQLH